MVTEADWLRLIRHVWGDAAATEAKADRAWIAADPARRELAEQLLAIRSAADPALPQWDTGALWRRFQAAHREELRSVARSKVVPLHPTLRGRAPWRDVWGSRLGPVSALAAAAGVVVGVGLMHFALPVAWGPQPFKEFTTTAGHIATLELRDGSRLVLGPASRLRVPSNFGSASARTVQLEGEAYFSVVHDIAHPFAVQTAYARIQDVGTVFAVQAYQADHAEKIAVAEGEVQVGALSLRARDLAVVTPTGAITVTPGVDLDPYLGWTQGRLVFNDTPLRDAAETLERTFNVHIQFVDTALASARVTGSFGSDRMDEVLTAVTAVVGARYEVKGETVVISRALVPAHGSSGTREPLRTARRDSSHA